MLPLKACKKGRKARRDLSLRRSQQLDERATSHPDKVREARAVRSQQHGAARHRRRLRAVVLEVGRALAEVQHLVAQVSE